MGITSDNKILKVLLVEDYAPLAMLLKRLVRLEDPDCRITWVDCGGVAIKAVKDGKLYDAIIVDYHMPLIDGAKLTKELRKLSYRGMIIGWSARLDPSRMDAWHHAGLDRHIEKTGFIKPLLHLLTTGLQDASK